MWSQFMAPVRDWGCKRKWFLPLSWAFLFHGKRIHQRSAKCAFMPAATSLSPFQKHGHQQGQEQYICIRQQQSGAHPTSMVWNTFAEQLHTTQTVFSCPGCWKSASHDSQMPRNLADHPTGRAVGFHWAQVVAGRRDTWYSLGTKPRSVSD